MSNLLHGPKSSECTLKKPAELDVIDCQRCQMIAAVCLAHCLPDLAGELSDQCENLVSRRRLFLTNVLDVDECFWRMSKNNRLAFCQPAMLPPQHQISKCLRKGKQFLSIYLADWLDHACWHNSHFLIWSLPSMEENNENSPVFTQSSRKDLEGLNWDLLRRS